MPQPWGLPHRVNLWTDDGRQWNGVIHNHPQWQAGDPTDTDPLWQAGPFESLPAALNTIRLMWPCLPVSNINIT